MHSDTRNVAVIGAGTIGASWTAFFLSHGFQVLVYDPEPKRSTFVRQYLNDCWPTMRKLNANCPPPDRWTFHSNLGDALIDAHFVQESAPENFEIKRRLYLELDRKAPPGIVIASSTSSLMITDLQNGLATPERFLVAHPFNPPHVIPVIELVGGQHTSIAALEWCGSFFTCLGKTVLRLRKEIAGHVINRLQAALFQEAIGLVRDGVVDIIDIDRGIAFGPALRWVLMGTFLTFHLGAREQGIRGYLDNLGPAHQRLWRDLKQVDELSPELTERIVRGVDEEAAAVPVAQLLAIRDELLVDLVNYIAGSRRLLG